MRAHLPHRAPTRRLGLAVAVVVAASLTAACGSSGSSADAASVSTSPPSTAGAWTLPPVEVPASGIALVGDVKNSRVISLEELGKLPQRKFKGSFGTHMGSTTLSAGGPLLQKLLPLDALATTDKKNDFLSFVVLLRADDGYSAAISWSEISPDANPVGAIISLVRDGKKLDRPGVVVPADKKAGRLIHRLSEIRVIRLG